MDVLPCVWLCSGFAQNEQRWEKLTACTQFDLNVTTYLFLALSEKIMKLGIEIHINRLTLTLEILREVVCRLT